MELRWANVRACGLFLLLAGPALVHAQSVEPPSLRCASVMGSDVRLNWVPPPGPPGTIDHYEVFQATSPAGPFTLVATVPPAPPSYVHAGAGADTGPRYYFMQSVSIGPPAETSAPSDTLATMFIQVSQSVPLGSSVVDWNLPHDPPLPTHKPLTIVGQGHGIADLQGIDSVPNAIHHWQRVVDECDVALVFMVAARDSSGCYSNSNIAGAGFQDITPPGIPVITEVTVDTTSNRAVLTWDPSPEADTQGYIIVLASAGNTILDTIYGRLNTTYEWPLSAAGNAPEAYTVAAIDSCWRGNPPSPNTSAASAPHTTVHLQTTYDRCEASIQVQRTDYGGWEVDHYEIYGDINDGPPFLAAVLDNGQHGYEAIGMQPGLKYCFTAKAVGTQPGQESLSNRSCRVAAYPAVPQWNYIRTVNVDPGGTVVIVDSLDANAYNRSLILEKSFNGGPFGQVGTYPGGFGPLAILVDGDVLPNERSYTYRITVLDSCGHEVATSNKGTSILLSTRPRADGANVLDWNGYVQWAGTVDHFTVYRRIGDGPFDPIAQVPGAQWSYADNVAAYAASPGPFCYYVVAGEAGNPSGINAEAMSNISCAVQQEEAWIPNAFISGGVNDTFKPVLAFTNASRYELIIYNRWGQQIWATTDRDQAWDGRVDGELVPQGVYAYYCSFVNGAGKTVVRSGTVTFLSGR